VFIPTDFILFIHEQNLKTMLFNFTMRKKQETFDVNQGLEQEREQNFYLDFQPTPLVEDDDAIQPMSHFDMSKIRGGRAVKQPDKFNTSCGGIIPQ
jgi:hypothetical protein